MEVYLHSNNAIKLRSNFFIYFRNIIQTYDGDHDNVCQTMEVAKWLVDCYRAMNKKFQPTATDIASYVQVIARNDSGKVSLDDLENFIARFFYNPQK